MLINGEKYACEACVRGHRVSSCTHSDRKLLHVNKKGRPVSQCQHCRSLRKARSQHVKCDCQDKAHAKEDCPHLKNELAGGNTTEPNTCCCGHGARCTCSLKKDILLDTVPEEFPQVIQPKETHKPRISSLNSHESKATVFINGHHKPVHKINDAHNHCGAPYRKPSRSHTVHGHREFAQRSTDSLPLLKQAPRMAESPLHTVTNAPEQVRKVKSEHNSPELGPINAKMNAMQELFIPPLSPNAYSYSPFDNQSSPALPTHGPYDLGLPETIPDSWFMTFDEAHTNDPAPCATFNEQPPIDWSQYGFCANTNDQFPMTTNGLISNPLTQYQNPFEHINLSALPRVNSSSGDISEADDHSIVNRPSNLRTVSNASNDISSPGDDFSDNHRLSTASSYHGTPQANMLAGPLGNLDIDEYVAQTVAEQRRMNIQRQSSHPHQTPPLQQTHTPPPMQQARSTPPMSQAVQSPPTSNPLQSPGLPRTQSMHQLSPQQTADSLQNKHQTPAFAMSPSPFGGEHAFTIREAQVYAHMNGNDQSSLNGDFSHSPMPATLTEDPMWSAPAGAFKLDDPREDEDWVR